MDLIISGNGNRLFKSQPFFFFLDNTEDRYNEGRMRILNEIVHEWDFYKEFFLELSVNEYRDLMSRDRKYGTSIELTAIANLFPHYLFRVTYTEAELLKLSKLNCVEYPPEKSPGNFRKKMIEPLVKKAFFHKLIIVFRKKRNELKFAGKRLFTKV